MKKYCALFLSFIMIFTLVSCGDNLGSCENKEKSAKNGEEFISQYNQIMDDLSLLNTSADFLGAAHSTIWNNVGVDKVQLAIENVAKYKADKDAGFEDDFDERVHVISVCDAFGVSHLNGADKNKALSYAETYADSMKTLKAMLEKIDSEYKELSENYGNDYNIEDLKQYYISSSAYANYASTIEGSYVTYNQTLSSYQSEIESLKKAAEIAH